MNFELESIPTASDLSTINIVSASNTDFRTFCLFNVSVNSNCSGVRLHHAVNYSEKQYLDIIEDQNQTCHYSGSVCRDYLSVHYGEGNNQRLTYCRDDLAQLDVVLDVNSFLVVHWTDDLRNPAGSFQVQAQCLEWLW